MSTAWRSACRLHEEDVWCVGETAVSLLDALSDQRFSRACHVLQLAARADCAASVGPSLDHRGREQILTFAPDGRRVGSIRRGRSLVGVIGRRASRKSGPSYPEPGPGASTIGGRCRALPVSVSRRRPVMARPIEGDHHEHHATEHHPLAAEGQDLATVPMKFEVRRFRSPISIAPRRSTSASGGESTSTCSSPAVPRRAVHAARLGGVDPVGPAGAERLQRLLLIVEDIEAARTELVDRGIEVSEIFHALPGEGPQPGRDPHGRSYVSQATFSDPDGNQWSCRRSPSGSRGGSKR